MNGEFMQELLHAAEAHQVYAEDFSDRLSSRLTSMGLLTLAAVAVTRQYVFKPIHCWVPANWPRSWEEFAENFCWTQGTYRVSMTDTAHPAEQLRGDLAINYFQWVPIVLLAQAALAMAPHQLWLAASRHLSGRDPHTAVRFAHEAERAGRPAVRQRLQAYAAWHLACGARLTDAGAAAATGRRRGCSEAVRQSGCALFAVYLGSKAAYLVTSLGQVLLLQSYLGESSPLFGLQIARNLLTTGGQQWQQSGAFPRVTFCDVPLRHVGQQSLHSVQCVLASNMIYEKIFVFLWFWFAFCCLATVVCAVRWLAELLPESARRRLVRSHLMMLPKAPEGEGEGNCEGEAEGEGESEEESGGEGDDKIEVDGEGEGECGLDSVGDAVRCLRLDGAFLLRMMADNADSLGAAQVLGRLVRLHRSHQQRWNHPSYPSEGNHPLGPVSAV